MSSLSQFVGGRPPKWVTGTTYREGYVVWSPTDYQYYMRKSTGAGATDPASDTTNWQPTGGRAVKSIQRGTLAYNAATATVTAVNTAKSELRMLGTTVNASGAPGSAYIVLTNGTTITHTVLAGMNQGGTSWELIERY